MTTNMTKGSPFMLILKFALPLFIGNMVLQLYTTIDAVIVRKTISTEAFSAVGSTGSIMFLVLGFILGNCVGLSVVTSQFYGASDINSVKRSIATSLVLGVGLSLIITIISVVFCRPLLEFMQTPDDIIDRSHQYLMVIFFGIFANFLYNFYASMMRALGNSKTPLYFLICASILNIFLDFVFIVYAKMDVSGAGLATVISQLVCGVGLYLYSRKTSEEFKLTRKDFVLDFEFCKKHLALALPMGFQFSIIAIGTIIVQIVLNNFGTEYITSYTAGNRIELILCQVYPAIGTAVVTYVAQNYGAGLISRIKEGVKIATIITTSYTLIASCILVFGGQFILKMILGSNEIPSIYSNAQIYLNFCAFAFFFLGVIYVYRNALQGISRGSFTLIAGIIELVVRSFVAIIFTKLLGFTGVCLATPITWVVTGVFLYISYSNIIKKLA